MNEAISAGSAFAGYNMTAKSRDSLTFHRIIEAFKFGYAWRSRLGDPAFNIDMNEVIETEIMHLLIFKRGKTWREKCRSLPRSET